MWVPAIVGIALALGFLVVIVLAAQQRSQRRRRPRARVLVRSCDSCGQLLGGLPPWERCPHCGYAAPLPPAQIEVVSGPLEGQTFQLEAEITTVGSQPGNHIVLPDPAVSRKHIGIRRGETGYELADLGSGTGVTVNGQRLAKRVLATGDLIRIGESEMVFQLQPTSKVG
jgi:hypothetical protein